MMLQKKLLKIIDTPEINDDFIYMYDDIVFLKPLKIDDFTLVMANDHVENIQTYWKKGARKPSDEWITPFNKTILKLKYHNLPTFNYETHLPRYLNKEKTKQIIERYKLEENTYMFSTLYFNTFYPKPDLIIRGSMIKADLTIPLEDQHMDRFIKGRKFLNYNDTGLNKSLIKYIQKILI